MTYGGGVISKCIDVLTDYSDVQNVRVVTDPYLDEASGGHAGRSVVSKFGANPDVGAGSTEDIWANGGLYTGFLQAASAVRIKAGGDSNDTAAGTGARSVVIVGLNENWEEAEEEVATAGASASGATTTTFVRVFRAYITDVGVYGGQNADDIVIETTGGAVMANIVASMGQTQMAIYTVPANKQAYIRRLSVSVEANKPTTVNFFQRRNADVVSTPFQGTRLFFSFAGLADYASEHMDAYIGPFPPKTDIWAQATGPTGGAAISATMDIILVNE